MCIAHYKQKVTSRRYANINRFINDLLRLRTPHLTIIISTSEMTYIMQSRSQHRQLRSPT